MCLVLVYSQVDTGSDTKTITWQLDGAEINGDTETITQSVPSTAGVRRYTVTASLSNWFVYISVGILSYVVLLLFGTLSLGSLTFRSQSLLHRVQTTVRLASN